MILPLGSLPSIWMIGTTFVLLSWVDTMMISFDKSTVSLFQMAQISCLLIGSEQLVV